MCSKTITTRYTDEPIEFAPWGDARPYDGGFRYNCMMIQVINIVIIIIIIIINIVTIVVNFIIMSPL